MTIMSWWVESFNQRAYLVWYAGPPLSPEDIKQSAKQQEENSFSSVHEQIMCGRLHVNVCESEVHITIDRPAIKASKKRPLNDK